MIAHKRLDITHKLASNPRQFVVVSIELGGVLVQQFEVLNEVVVGISKHLDFPLQ